MKILIDIGHPAHVHYFKNTISKLKTDGHSVFVIAREKEITFDLLRAYHISYISRGKGKNNLIGKFFYLFNGAFQIWRLARKQHIDLFLSFASPYNALASIIYRKPNISFDDTEHNVFNHRIYVPLSSAVLTPVDFKRDFGNKQIRFNATMDAAYLHPMYFTPQKVTFNYRNTTNDNPKKKVILRLVSWNASHDVNEEGISIRNVYHLIKTLSDFAEIYISSEQSLPLDLDKYSIRIKPEEMHHYMSEADLFIGESGSMATEAAFLGTHSIVLNSAAPNFGVFQRLAKYETFYIAQDFDDLMNTAVNYLRRETLKAHGKRVSEEIIKDGINLTDFMVWFIENYPSSVKTMKENPDYQSKFR